MAELVDAHDSKSCGSDSMRVQVPLAVHRKIPKVKTLGIFLLWTREGLEQAGSETRERAEARASERASSGLP